MRDWESVLFTKRVDSICRHVMVVFVCGDDQANGMQTVTLWNTIGMVVAPLRFGVKFV